MTYHLLSIAEEDLASAARFYESQVAGLGGDFLDEFEATMQRICQFPDGWHRVSRRHRLSPFRRFPFAVLYTAEADKVMVSGVMDLRMDPARQRERMNET